MSSSIQKKIVISEDWKVYIISLVLDMVITNFILNFDPLGFKPAVNNSAMLFVIYALYIFVIVLLLIALHNALIDKLKRKEFKKVVELSVLMEKGIDILRYVRQNCKYATEKELAIPIEGLDKWHNEIYSKYMEINPIWAKIWFTSELESDIYLDADYGKDTAKFLNIIDSKINLLKKDLNSFNEAFIKK